MAIHVLVPRLGEGVEEVIITKWLKQVGDSINELEPLLEVNTDKVDTEIPAPASGLVLQISAREGQAAKVGDLLAVIGAVGETISETPPPTPDPVRVNENPSHASPAPAAQSSIKSGFISPVVARLAAEHKLDLSAIQGTGMNGRITKNDVLAFLDSPRPEAQLKTAAAPASPASMVEGADFIKHTAMRKSIAHHMVESKHTSPHVLTVMEADMSRVIKHRAANKAQFERDGVNLTFTAYFMMAIVAGLKAFPQTNASWTEEGLLIHKNINLGMAVSLGEEGLIVPVIKTADHLSLLAMARAVNDLAVRSRNKKLQPDDVQGGTFTLTNHGVSGSLFAFPIIHQPQAGILGVGAMRKRAIVVSAQDGTGEDALAIRPMVYLSLVFDHRILDGASADWFLAKVKETLENWS